MEDKKQDFPIIICPCYIRTSSTIFCLADKKIEIHAPKLLINDLLKTCNGEKTIDEVVAILAKKWQPTLVKKFLENLKQVGVICDSRTIGNYVWPFVKNPTRFVHDLSDEEILQLVQKAHKRHVHYQKGIPLVARPSHLQKIIEQRRSIRVFSQKEANPQIIAQLLWTGYGIVQSPLLIDDDNPQQVKVWQKYSLARHTVPSAGALYPLRLSLGLLRPSGSITAGIYSVCCRKSGLVELKLVSDDLLGLLQSLADQSVCNNAQGIIVVSGSFNISAEKYGNRSLLYVSLEAGHVAQNIHLAAVECKVGTVELGGFLEEPLRQALRLPPDYWPLITIIFGYPATTSSANYKSKDSIELRWAYPSAGEYQLPFSMAFAQLKNQKGEEWACGRSKEPTTAFLKAYSEANEWDACGRVPDSLVRASFRELKNAIDPRKIVCYHSRQYLRKAFLLKPFAENQKYFWKEGQDEVTGNKVYILSDCIYFPYTPKTPRYTFANSSGTAAHPDRLETVKNATLELIERDAFMIIWLNRLKTPRISLKSLPPDIQKRIWELQKLGFKVVIKNFTLDLTPVLFVFAQSETLPMTTCAACSMFEVTTALDHALMEVEATIYCRLNSQSPKPIQPKKVHYTDEHGNLYEQHEYFHRADFLVNGGKLLRLSVVAKNAPKTWSKLMERLKAMESTLITVDLLEDRVQQQVETLNIVKVFVPGLVPMSFGYGLEPCGMGRIYNLPVRLGYRAIPISYSQLTKFPHPYT